MEKMNIFDVVAVTGRNPAQGVECKAIRVRLFHKAAFPRIDATHADHRSPTRKEDAGRSAGAFDALRRRKLLRCEVSK
jgi:hypothetical protein